MGILVKLKRHFIQMLRSDSTIGNHRCLYVFVMASILFVYVLSLQTLRAPVEVLDVNRIPCMGASCYHASLARVEFGGNNMLNRTDLSMMCQLPTNHSAASHFIHLPQGNSYFRLSKFAWQWSRDLNLQIQETSPARSVILLL